MKRIYILAFVLALLLCSCTFGDFSANQTTPQETTPVATTPTVTTPKETTPEVTTPDVTTPDVTTPDVTTPEQPPHEHIFENPTVTKSPTCQEEGEKTANCTCGETEVTKIPATGVHQYAGTSCVWCRGVDPSLGLTPVPSAYDADGDGKNDVYHFSTQLFSTFQKGVHVWAGDYDKTLSSSSIGTATFVNIKHWYVAEESGQYIVYRVTVPEAGIYEMAIHMRMKDSNERGTKYTVNEGTEYEQVFETSHSFAEKDGYLTAPRPPYSHPGQPGRIDYEAAKAYNTMIRQFPDNIIASMFGFEKKAYFEAQAGAETAPKVEF